MNLNAIKYAYFLGIGGIGMSAIARYFHSLGIEIHGYDKTPSPLTDELIDEGMIIHFDENTEKILPRFIEQNNECIFVYTPAIPSDHKELVFLLDHHIQLYKRSEILGFISNDSFCIAVAGTHGKTTTSTLIAHLLHEGGINFTAFLGGISSNYNTNYIHKTDGRNLFPDKPVVVLEADEFDRSFHRLSPDIAVITAIDADHLDIYHTPEAFDEAFYIFSEKIKNTGALVYQFQINKPLSRHVQNYSYGMTSESNVNFRSRFDGIQNGYFQFGFFSSVEEDGAVTEREISGMACGLPGFHNIENATAATGVCLDLLGLDRFDVKHGLKSFKGVKRRFEYIVRNNQYVVIDDYAHHPQELNAIIGSVKELYPDKKVCGIFQPHLFTRTRDFAEGFASSLSKLDELVLMEIYPARELPIEGINGQWLLDKVEIQNKKMLDAEGILNKIKMDKPELLLILGAGDIDRIVPKIQEVYGNF